MIPEENRGQRIAQFREGKPGPSEDDVREMDVTSLVAACLHALENEYDVSDLAERDSLRKRHIEALAMAMWHELHGEIEHPEEIEDIETFINDRLNDE